MYTFTQQLCYEEGFSLLALGPLPLGHVEPSVRGGPCRWTTWNLGPASSGRETPDSGTSHLLLWKYRPAVFLCRVEHYWYHFFIINFDCSIVGLTVCVSFCFTAKRTNYVFTCVSLFFGFPSHLGPQSPE